LGLRHKAKREKCLDFRGALQLPILLPSPQLISNDAANGATTTGTFDGGAGTNVSLPWNAKYYNTAQSGWDQPRVELASPDQEGFDPNLAEIGFTTNSADSAEPTISHFSYRLDSYLTSFYYELQDSRKSDSNEWKTDTATVPLPPTLLFFGSGLLGLVGWRRFRKG
jgi:hypothetical protein